MIAEPAHQLASARRFFEIPPLRGRRLPARRRSSGTTPGTPSISERRQPAARYWVAPRRGTSTGCPSPLSGCSAGGRKITRISTRFLVARSKDDGSEALRIRREVVQEAAKQLFTPEERRFFDPLLSPKFALTASASRFRDRAEQVAGHLRETALTAKGPLCLVLSWRAEDRLSKLWNDPSRPWRGAWLEESCRQGRFLPGVQTPARTSTKRRSCSPTDGLCCALSS